MKYSKIQGLRKIILNHHLDAQRKFKKSLKETSEKSDLSENNVNVSSYPGTQNCFFFFLLQFNHSP